MRARRVLASLLLLATMMAFPGCTPPEDIAYVEDENARLKQLLIKYENDARNNQVMIAESNGRVQRTNLELEAANRKIGVYEQEIPRLRTLAVQAAGTAQAANQAQYAQYQQYVDYINRLNKQYQQARMAAPAQGTGTLRSDLAQSLGNLAEQFGGVIVGNRLELPGDFFFDSGRYDLNPNARAAIRRMAEILAGENLQLMVVGHTDNDPIKNPALRSRGITDNLHLSLLRSKAVVDELKKAGYPSNLMYPTGWGDLKPIVPNTDRASKKLNRRVDILIDPTMEQSQGMSQITGVEPVAGGTSFSSSTTYTSEPMSTTYVQGDIGGPSFSTIEGLEPVGTPGSVYSAAPTYGGSYGQTTTSSVTTTYENLGGTADLIGGSTYDSYSVPSMPSTVQTYDIQTQPYDPYGAPQSQPYMVPADPFPTSQPQPFAPQPFTPQPFGTPDPYAPSPYAQAPQQQRFQAPPPYYGAQPQQQQFLGGPQQGQQQQWGQPQGQQQYGAPQPTMASRVQQMPPMQPMQSMPPMQQPYLSQAPMSPNYTATLEPLAMNYQRPNRW